MWILTPLCRLIYLNYKSQVDYINQGTFLGGEERKGDGVGGGGGGNLSTRIIVSKKRGGADEAKFLDPKNVLLCKIQTQEKSNGPECNDPKHPFLYAFR